MSSSPEEEDQRALKPRSRRAFGCVTWVYMATLAFLAVASFGLMPIWFVFGWNVFSALEGVAFFATLLILPAMVLGAALGLRTYRSRRRVARRGKPALLASRSTGARRGRPRPLRPLRRCSGDAPPASARPRRSRARRRRWRRAARRRLRPDKRGRRRPLHPRRSRGRLDRGRGLRPGRRGRDDPAGSRSQGIAGDQPEGAHQRACSRAGP